MRRIAVCVISLAMAGCATTVWYGDRSTMLSLGMSKKQVQDRFGPPQDIMTHQLQGMMVETWRYLDRSVIFHNGVVQSWTLGAPAQAPDGRQQPSGS